MSFIRALVLKCPVGHVLQKRLAAQAQADANHGPARYRLQGRVEIDDAYLGGERAGSVNGGRKAMSKTAFVAAVQTTVDGRPQYARLVPVVDTTNAEMQQWAKRHLAPGCHVASDSSQAFGQVKIAQASHERHVTGGGRHGAQTAQLHWVNTLLGNLKTSMAGA